VLCFSVSSDKPHKKTDMALALKDNQRHCYGDYLTWLDGKRYELIDGNAYLIPQADLIHQDVA
jgi:hypothetical protein